MRSKWSSDVENEPENIAFEVGPQRVAMTSYSDVHVQVNVYLNLPIIVPQFYLILSLGTPTRYADALECAGSCLFKIDSTVITWILGYHSLLTC